MRYSRSIKAAMPVAGLALLGLVAGSRAASAASPQMVEPDRLDSMASVEDLTTEGGELSGQVVNRTDKTLTDVHILTTDLFVWKNERHPGDDDPSRAEERTIPGPIPPHASVSFRFEREPLPRRTDGAFTTMTRVLGLTEQDTRPEARSETPYPYPPALN